MSAMRARLIKLVVASLSLALVSSITSSASISASNFNSAPATKWGQIIANPKANSAQIKVVRAPKLEGSVKSEWIVSYTSFPKEGREAVQLAVDIWSRNFSSKVPINIEVRWESKSDNSILGSARPGRFFNNFPGAPDSNLWYPSALANSLAGRDLDPNQKEIFLSINSNPLWYTGVDGNPNSKEYDLTSVVLHEIAHGLGFLSNAEYDSSLGTGTGYMFQPTPFDAYVQLPDGRTFMDFCSRSADLGKAMLGPLYWSGSSGTMANNGVAPKLHTPQPYLPGSSITHIDEETFSASLSESIMTPNLSPGEVFRSPGSIALGMLDDMLRKPPVRAATKKPNKPVNFKALIGDGYALLTFDSLNCTRLDQVKSYSITIFPSGETRTFNSAPMRITGLKNGQSYKFSIVAVNEFGRSDPIESASIRPEKTGAVSTIDSQSKSSSLASSTYRGLPVIFYGDERSSSLKQASYEKGAWRIKTIRQGVDVGPISICKEGKGSKESLHLFYGELREKDLHHSQLLSGQWRHEIVDGNGERIQEYRDLRGARTASEVSVSNACALTTQGLQVFYRDETQGLLLAAVRTSSGWVYEVVDGDKRDGGRTVGDVAFSISAVADNGTVHLLYDSVLTINSSGAASEGEVRYAYRKSIFPEDWRYKSIDGPENGSVVAGYATAMFNNKGKIYGAWFFSRGESLPGPNQVAFVELGKTESPTRYLPELLGAPNLPLNIDASGILFGCSKRLCQIGLSKLSANLVSGLTSLTNSGGIILIKNKRYLATLKSKRVSLLPL